MLDNFPQQGTQAVQSTVVSAVGADPVLTTEHLQSQFEWGRKKEVGSLELANVMSADFLYPIS